MSWQPSADIETLKQRADYLQATRAFFLQRGYLEVQTPLLAPHTVTDRFIDSWQTSTEEYYLQTSPEYYMKRLLAAGSGPIFQIGKAFRDEQHGRLHNPEFTLLEFYQPGFDHLQLMQELSSWLETVFHYPPALTVCYDALFTEYLNINIDDIPLTQLQTLAQQHSQLQGDCKLDRDTALQLLFCYCIEPHLGFDQPVFVTDYPVTQAALAKVNQQQPPRAERFELFIQGTELANGFHELTDADQQRARFEADLAARTQYNQSAPQLDEKFLQSLKYLPDCAGVAVGMDRLLMLACNKKQIDDVISFGWEQL
jgi:elongation factor P--(R)-beta-lysine ligase